MMMVTILLLVVASVVTIVLTMISSSLGTIIVIVIVVTVVCVGVSVIGVTINHRVSVTCRHWKIFMFIHGKIISINHEKIFQTIFSTVTEGKYLCLLHWNYFLISRRVVRAGLDTTSLHHALLTTDLLLTAAASFWSQLPLNNDCSSKCLTLIMKSQDTDSVRGNREKHD